MLKQNLRSELSKFCISIISTGRSLDLRANESEVRDHWAHFLYDLLIGKREYASKRYKELRKKYEFLLFYFKSKKS